VNNYVREWQKTLGIYEDGLFGPNTLKASLDHMSNGVSALPKTGLLPSSLFPKVSRMVKELIWHCTATPEHREISAATIRSWHVDGRGWSDIGYHYIVHLDGSIEAGRPLNRVGAHAAGHNRYSIGAVYVGGMDSNMINPKDTRTAAQKASMLALTEELCRRYNLNIISGHNQYAPKACPSFSVVTDKLGNIDGFKKGERI